MNRQVFTVVVFIGSILVACTGGVKPLGSVDGSNNVAATTTSTTIQAKPSFKYFGYYASGMDGIGTLEDIDELKDKSNLFFVHSGKMREMLEKCRQVRMKAVASFNWLMFDANNRLYPDWKDRVKWATDIIDDFQDVVVAIYIMDEPYMNAANTGVTLNEMYGYLDETGKFFKARYPNIALPIIFSMTEMKAGYKLPPSYDWFGLDCYGSFYWCERNTIPNWYKKLKADVEKLEAADGRERYLMAVPPAGYDTKDNNSENNHADQVSAYRQFIKSDPKIKIVMPFLWQSFSAGGDGWVGARDSQKLKPLYIKMYADFMNDKL